MGHFYVFVFLVLILGSGVLFFLFRPFLYFPELTPKKVQNQGSLTLLCSDSWIKNTDRFGSPWIPACLFKNTNRFGCSWIPASQYKNRDRFSGPWIPAFQFQNSEQFGGPWIPASFLKDKDQLSGPWISFSKFGPSWQSIDPCIPV